MSNEGTRDFWRVLAAYLLPPLGVFMQVGFGVPFWINLILTCLLYVPGQIHAVWVIATTGPRGRTAPDGTSTFIALLVALFIPPVAVFLKKGLGMPVLINLVLWMIFLLPGTLHAVWVITHDD